MIRAQIIDVWGIDGRFGLNVAYGDRGDFFDVSGQPSPPQTPCIIEGVVSDAVYNEILDDPNYGIGAVLWSEVESDGT